MRQKSVTEKATDSELIDRCRPRHVTQRDRCQQWQKKDRELRRWPKDFIAQKVVGSPVLFGEEALNTRLSLDLFRPLERGVIKERTRDQEAVRELIHHLIDLMEPRANNRVRAVIGVPAESSGPTGWPSRRRWGITLPPRWWFRSRSRWLTD